MENFLLLPLFDYEDGDNIYSIHQAKYGKNMVKTCFVQQYLLQCSQVKHAYDL